MPKKQAHRISMPLSITHIMYRFMYRYEKNSNSVSIRYDLKRTEESKSTPTEYLKSIIVGMVTPY